MIPTDGDDFSLYAFATRKVFERGRRLLGQLNRLGRRREIEQYIFAGLLQESSDLSPCQDR